MTLPEPTDRIFQLDGYRMHDTGGRIGQWLAKGAPYEHRLLYQIRDTIPPGVAFDVGAHIGNHSLFLAANGFDVHAWEPYGYSRSLLHRNLLLNPHLSVKVHPWAAGDRDTVGRFTRGMWLEFDPTRDGATLKVDRGDVPVHRIDDRVAVDSLAVVKVDVEGMEPHVLRGMRQTLRLHRPVVYCETHTKDKEDEIRSVLEPLGYTLTEKLRQGSPMHRWDP